MPIQLTPTHRCRFKVKGGFRGGDVIERRDETIIVIDRLTGIPWEVNRNELERNERGEAFIPIEAKRNEEGVVS